MAWLVMMAAKLFPPLAAVLVATLVSQALALEFFPEGAMEATYLNRRSDIFHDFFATNHAVKRNILDFSRLENDEMISLSTPGLCQFTAAVTDRKVTLTMKNVGDCTTPSIKQVCQDPFRQTDIDTAMALINTEAFKVNKIEYNVATQDVSITSQNAANIRWLIYFPMLSRTVTLKMSFTHVDRQLTFQDLAIEMDGTTSIHVNFEVTIRKDKGSEWYTMSLAARNSQIDLVRWVNKIQIYVTGLALEEDGFFFDQLNEYKVHNPLLNGAVTKTGDWQLVLKGALAEGSQAFQLSGADFRMMFTNLNGGAPHGACLLVSFPRVETNAMDVLLPILTKAPLEGFPIFRVVPNTPLALTVSAGDFELFDHEAIKNEVKHVIPPNHEQVVKQGINVKYQINIRDNLINHCKINANEVGPILDKDGNQVTTLSLNASVKASGVSFQFPDNVSTPIGPMLKCMQPLLSASLPSELFPNPDSPVAIEQIQFTPGVRGVTTMTERKKDANGDWEKRPGTSTQNTNLPFFFRLGVRLKTSQIPISNITGGRLKFGDIKLAIQTTGGRAWDFIGTTSAIIDGVDVLFQLKKSITFGSNTTASPYTFTAMIPSILLANVTKLVKDESKTAEGESKSKLIFTDYWVKDLTIEIQIDPTGYNFSSIRMRGRPIFGSATTTAPVFELVLWKAGSKTNSLQKMGLAFGLWFGGLSLDEIMERIVGKSSTDRFKWLTNMQAILVVSYDSMKAVAKTKAESDAEKKADEEMKRTGNRIPDLQAAAAAAPPVASPAAPSGARKDSVHSPSSFTHSKKPANPLVRRTKAKENAAPTYDPPELKFNYPGLVSTKIQRGFTGMLWWGLPMVDSKCLNDSMCLWLLETFGTGFEMQLILYVGGPTNFEITAALRADIRISEHLRFQRAMLKLKVDGANSCVRVECEMSLTYPPLTKNTLALTGAIIVKFSGGLSLEFSLGGMIVAPFGFQYAAFGNLIVAFGFGKNLPLIELGCEFWLGKITDVDAPNTHLLKFKVYVGVNPSDPKDIYVYAYLNKLTLIDALNAFEVDHGLSPNNILGRTGFPGPFIFSYAMQDKYIKSIGLQIFRGLYINGTINILGWQLWGRLIITEQVMEINVNMDPINWAGGMVRVQRSSADEAHGPTFYFRANMVETMIRANISGYCSVLGIWGEVVIVIAENYVMFNLSGRPWPGIIQATLYAKAVWTPGAEMGFIVTLTFTDALAEIKRVIKEYLARMATAADEAIKKAQQKLNEVQLSLDAANRESDKKIEELESHKRRLDEKSRLLEAEKAKYNTDCSTECPKVCMGFLDWNPCGWTVWGACVGCPVWNSCRWMIADLICLAKCELTKLANKFAVWINQVGLKIQSWVADIQAGLIKALQGLRSLGRALLDVANGALSFVNSAVSGFAMIATKLIEAVDFVFTLRKFMIGLSVNATAGICGTFEIDCRFLGHDVLANGTACLSMNFLTQVAEGTSEKQYPGISKTEENLEKYEGKAKDVENTANQFQVDKAKTVQEVTEGNQEAQALETSQARRSWIPGHPIPRSRIPYVRNEQQTKYLEQAEEPIPPYILRRDLINEKMEKSSPWAFASNFDFASIDLEPKFSKDSNPSRRTLEIDERDLSPCVRFKRAMESYSALSSGLLHTTSTVAAQLKAYDLNRRSYLAGVDDVTAQVRDLETRHNLTDHERSDAYFWHDKLRQGFNDYEERSKRALDHQHEYVMPILRGQLNAFLRREKKTDLDTYLENLHSHAIDAFKRTAIPSPASVNGEETLDKIRKSLISVINSETISHDVFHKRLHDTQAHIRSLRHVAADCPAHG